MIDDLPSAHLQIRKLIDSSGHALLGLEQSGRLSISTGAFIGHPDGDSYAIKIKDIGTGKRHAVRDMCPFNHETVRSCLDALKDWLIEVLPEYRATLWTGADDRRIEKLFRGYP